MNHDEPGGLLRTIVAVLEAAGIPYMVVGSFASTAHGEPRTTRDLDLVIDPTLDQPNALIGALDSERFYVDPDVARDALRRRSMFNVIEIACGPNAWLLVGSDDHGQAAGNLLTLMASARLHKLDPEVYLRDVFRVLPHWPRDRHLELAPRYSRITPARLDRNELDREVGWLTLPELPLPTMLPSDLLAAPSSPAP